MKVPLGFETSFTIVSINKIGGRLFSRRFKLVGLGVLSYNVPTPPSPPPFKNL